MTKLKLQILKHIAAAYFYDDEPTYEQMLEAVYDNYYRSIAKVPADVFLLGNVQSFVLRDVEHANKILTAIKEVVVEALEVSGIEVTFTDEDWYNLKIVENRNPTMWSPRYTLENSKSYMSEFFEQ